MKYWASIKVNFDVQLDDLEAESAEDAKDQAYDKIKELINQSTIQPPMRPMGITVVYIGKSDDT